MTPSDKIAILAAGKSTRMRSPLPKILLTLHSQPMLRYVVDAARGANDDRPIVVVSPEHREAVARMFGDEIVYVEQLTQRGTGHAVMSISQEQLGGSQNLIVLYGDHPLLTTPTIRRLIDAHAAAHGPLSIMTLTVPSFDGEYAEFQSFGRVLRKSDGTLDRIVEYKDATEEIRKVKEVNPGFYCFDISWLYAHLPQLKDENVQKEYYLTDLIGIARKENTTVVVVPIDNPLEGLGVNTPEAFALAEKVLEGRMKS